MCGATVRGIDLREPIAPTTVAALREAWLRHRVISFPDQNLSIDDLERVAASFGPFGEDRFIRPIDGHPHVIQVKRDADEQTPLFADTWHSDWSFMATPPAATLLYGVEIPPTGGDTLFADMHTAFDALPAERQEQLLTMSGVHSARRGYSTHGAYGERDKGRSMRIVASDDAMATQLHPLVRTHPETGRPALYCSLAYTIGIDGLSDDDGNALVAELQRHATQDRFVYRHRWSPGMLTLWDNRCLLHSATGGYDGHRRRLYRITIAEQPRPAWANADVVFATVDPRAAEARIAVGRYFAELDDRFPAGFDPGDATETDAPAMSPPGGAFVVARSNGAPVGCGGLQRLDDSTGEIKRMWIDPGFRGRGLGRRLLDHLEAIAAELGHTRIVLDTNATLVEAIAMYESAGYMPTDRYNDNPYAQRWFVKQLGVRGRWPMTTAVVGANEGAP